MILPGETEAGTAGTQPCRGISRRAHRDDERGVRARSCAAQPPSDRKTPCLENPRPNGGILTNGEVRGKPNYPGWYIYEVNRAMCRIMLDDRFAAKQPSETTVRDAIRTDMRLSVEVDYLRRILEDEPVVQDWLRLNKLDLDSL